MAVALTESRQLLWTASNINDVPITYEFYGHYERNGGRTKVILEVKPVSSYTGNISSPTVTATIGQNNGGSISYPTIEAIGHPFRIPLNDYYEITSVTLSETYMREVSLNGRISGGTYSNGGTSITCTSEQTSATITAVYPSIWVKFDNTRIDDNSIIGLHQTVNPYNQGFSIGNTVCRQFDLSVSKTAYSTIPTNVYLMDDLGNKYATLLVDNYDNQNDDYTVFNLTDVMVRLNKTLDYTSGDTVATILSAICTAHGITNQSGSLYMSDFAINWDDQLTEREFISYVAEVNGGYAYINNDGNLVIQSYSNTVAGTVDADYCSDIRVGETHHIDRVYVELATDTRYYPQTGTYDTLYLNSNNILLTDTTQYPLNSIIQHIYSVVNGLIFVDMKIERCPVTTARACQMLKLTNFGTDIPFICVIDYDYNVGWYGGYESQFENKVQEESKTGGEGNLSRRISIIVDRELGTITQEINELSNDINSAQSSFTQTANSLEMRVSTNENAINNTDPNNLGLNQRMTQYQTVVNIQPDGVYISQNNDSTAYVKFTASGMEIYVEGVKTAWAEADGFSSEELMIGGAKDSEKWHMHMANNGNTLMFLRR